MCFHISWSLLMKKNLIPGTFPRMPIGIGSFNNGKWLSELTIPQIWRVGLPYWWGVRSPVTATTIMNAPRFTPGAVHKELSPFDTAKGSGPDDLHPFMLQNLADCLAEPNTALCNKYLQSGEVPQDWLKPIVCLILRKWDSEDASNYCSASSSVSSVLLLLRRINEEG